MLTTLSFEKESQYCLDHNGEELTIEDIIRIELEIEEEEKCP